jgi:2-dehydro-3-deoxyphosphogluconate aldolase/(4S)-4-hydroxy-2-oxoglutarate aldolase
MNLLDLIKEHRMIVILRGIDRERIQPVAEALYLGGARMVEITMNTEGAPKQIASLVENYAGKMIVGAGTVLNVEMAQQAIAAGATYLITPNLDERVIDFSLQNGVGVLPGVMTVTEIVRAFEAGASMVKLFPAGTLGVGYLKELQGPISHIPIVAVGGVTLDNVKEYMQAGTIGVGVGGGLLERKGIAEGNYDELTIRTKRFIQAIKECE